VNRRRLEADPDATFHFDANPDPDPDPNPDPDPTPSSHMSESQNFQRLLFTAEPFYIQISVILIGVTLLNILESILKISGEKIQFSFTFC
jgi:hypothetical protein